MKNISSSVLENLTFDILVSYLAGKLSDSQNNEVESMLSISESNMILLQDIKSYMKEFNITPEELLTKTTVDSKGWINILDIYYSNKPIEHDTIDCNNIAPVLKKIKDDINLKSCHSKLNKILSKSRAAKVAVQGDKGCFHEIVSYKFFDDHIVPEYCKSFRTVLEKLENGDVNYAVISIENSVAGSILENYDLIREHKVTIIGEIDMYINHNLMTLPGQDISDIKEVHSHPMAIRQCKKFFEKIYPDIRLIERDDTAGSARWIRETMTPNVAAIASELAAKYYDLKIIAKNIHTQQSNVTKFLILLDEESAKVYPRNKNKASICFSLADKVGSLAKILSIFETHCISLTKIQSMPILEKRGKYFFI